MTSSAATDLLLERARAWQADDPDDITRAELAQVIADVEGGADATDLADRFDGTLEFGTAGLRGAVGAGPNRMNRAVVTRAAAGLAAYLLEQGATGPIVVGYDARHRSDDFARDTAEVMTGAGFKVWVLPRPLPTPVLAFSIRELGCAAGVMVTASHNPPQDNGYKVYLGDGSQIVPPADSGIAAQIAAVGRLADIPRGSAGDVLGEHLVDRYLDTVAELAQDGPRDLDIVYTPLHGVGGTSAVQVLETAGFSAPRVVAEQEQPDPDFPTVPFPNPEEPGAMDLAMALAEQHGADLVVANDPDADRCAAAVPTGARLADAARRRGRRAAGQPPDGPRPHRHLCGVDRLLQPAREDGGGRRAAVRRDAHRVQVDRPGRGADLRLRGGARLLRRPRARAGQGRRLGAAAALRAGRRDQGRRPHPGRRARRPRRPARPARHRPGLGAGGRPVPDRAGDGAAPRHAADLARRPRGRVGRRPLRRAARRCRRRTGCATTSPTAPG